MILIQGYLLYLKSYTIDDWYRLDSCWDFYEVPGFC